MASTSYRGVKNRLAFDCGELLSKVVTPDNVAVRMSERYTGTAGELNRWVDALREVENESVPYFDPAAAADAAKVLMLLQDPSGAADDESGFISLHNNDQTAHNVYKLSLRSGLRYADYLPWNVIPWWVKNPTKGARTLKNEARRARPYLEEILDILPSDPAAVLVMGKTETWPAWQAVVGKQIPKSLRNAEIIFTAHPSPLSINQINKVTGRRNGDEILDSFIHAAKLCV